MSNLDRYQSTVLVACYNVGTDILCEQTCASYDLDCTNTGNVRKAQMIHDRHLSCAVIPNVVGVLIKRSICG